MNGREDLEKTVDLVEPTQKYRSGNSTLARLPKSPRDVTLAAATVPPTPWRFIQCTTELGARPERRLRLLSKLTRWR